MIDELTIFNLSVKNPSTVGLVREVEKMAREEVLNTLKRLINSDYNSRECHLLYSDLCEFLEEKNNGNKSN